MSGIMAVECSPQVMPFYLAMLSKYSCSKVKFAKKGRLNRDLVPAM